MNCPRRLKPMNRHKKLLLFVKKLGNQGLANVRFEISVVRGFDYYTGIVFDFSTLTPKTHGPFLAAGGTMTETAYLAW